MRRFLISLILILILSSSSFSQGVVPQNPEDSVMQKLFASALYCQTIVERTPDIVKRLIEHEKIDSIEIVLNYVDQQCGKQNGYKSLYTLISVHNNTWQEEYGVDYIKGEIAKYIDRDKYDLCYIWRFTTSFRGPYYQPDSDNIEELAKYVIKSQDTNSLGYLYCLTMIDDYKELFKYLRENAKIFPDIYAYYLKRINILRNDLYNYRTIFELNAGLRTNIGKSKVIGDKGEIGAIWGYYFKPYYAGIYGNLRGLNGNQDYLVREGDVLYKPKNNVGGSFGAEFGWEYLNQSRFSQLLVFGIGYDGFTVTKNIDGDWIAFSSLVTSIGVTTRYFFGENNDKFIGLNIRYNNVNYKSSPSDLSGNNLSINLSFGWSIFSDWKKNIYEKYIKYNQ